MTNVQDLRPRTPQAPAKMTLDMITTVANGLTLVRAVGAIFLATLLYTDTIDPAAAVIFFGVLALTDLLDGVYARHTNSATPFGASIDPMADKVLVASVLLATLHTGLVPLLAIWLMLVRDIVTEWAKSWAVTQNSKPIAVLWLAKVKTALQMVLCAMVLAHPFVASHTPNYAPFVGSTIWLLAWVTVGFTLWSAWGYLRAAFPQ
ncbi:MAG: CDP-alcohol phosphatidyltransferase family protein [Alphaproteobacteria bacterium]